MRLFHITYEEALDLPAEFTQKALAWDGVENEARRELEKREANR